MVLRGKVDFVLEAEAEASSYREAWRIATA